MNKLQKYISRTQRIPFEKLPTIQLKYKKKVVTKFITRHAHGKLLDMLSS